MPFSREIETKLILTPRGVGHIMRAFQRGTPMQRIMKKSKIHTASITGLELYYEGSVTIDRDLLDLADMLPGEQVQIVNLNNGSRIETFIIPGKAGSGQICLNGPAARLGLVGDQVIILSFAAMEPLEAKNFKPKVIHLDENNKIKK